MNLTEARRLYNQVQERDGVLIHEHLRLLKNEMQKAIQNSEQYLDYRIPLTLIGPYPMYDPYEMGVMMLQWLRREGYHARFRKSEPYMIRVWGWRGDLEPAPKPKPKPKPLPPPPPPSPISNHGSNLRQGRADVRNLTESLKRRFTHYQ